MHKGGPGFGVFYLRPVQGLIWLLARSPLSANQITVIQFLLAVLVSLLLSRSFPLNGFTVLAVFGVYVCEMLSYVDGCVARLKGQTSSVGIWLDHMVENSIFILFFFGITWGWYRVDGSVLPWILLAVLLAVRWFQTYALSEMTKTIKHLQCHEAVFKPLLSIAARFGVGAKALALGADTHALVIAVLVLIGRPVWIMAMFIAFHGSVLIAVCLRVAFSTSDHAC